MARSKKKVKRKKVEGDTTGDASRLSPPFFHEEARTWVESCSYAWPPTLVCNPSYMPVTHVRGSDSKKLLNMDLAQKGFRDAPYEHHTIGSGISIFVFAPTGRGFAAVWSLSRMPAYNFAAMRVVQNTGIGKWFPIVSQSEVHISTERPKRPETQECIMKDVDQIFEDIQLLALSPLQRTQLQERMLVLRDAAFSSGFNHELQPNDLHSELEELMKEAAEWNQNDVKELLQDSFQRQSMLKILFTLNGAGTTKHLLTRIQQLMTCLNDTNKTADGGDRLMSRIINKGIEMELKTLDLLGKRIQENNSIEVTLRRKDLDIVSSMRAFLTKQHEDFMKHLQELVANKEESLGELLPSRLELVMNIRSQPDVSNMTNFFSTTFGKIVQEAHKSTLADATTKTECVICLGEFGGFETADPNLQKRGCFLPCMHASVCILCCEHIWKRGVRFCPLCQTKLTERPKLLYL